MQEQINRLREYGFDNVMGLQVDVSRTHCPYMFKHDFGATGGKLSIAVFDLDEFIRRYEACPQKNFYEYFSYNVPIAEYYDIDILLPTPLTSSQLESKCIRIIDHLLQCRESILDTRLYMSDFIILSAHTNTKLSLHLISKKTYFVTNEMQKLYARALYDSMDENIAKIDKAPYMNGQCFRMIHSSKIGKDNPFVFYLCDPVPIKDTLVRLHDIGNRVCVYYTPPQRVQEISSKQCDEKEECAQESLDIGINQYLQQYTVRDYDYNACTRQLTRKSPGTDLACLVNPSITHQRRSYKIQYTKKYIAVVCFSPKCAFHSKLLIRKVTKSLEDFTPDKVPYSLNIKDVDDAAYKQLLDTHDMIIDISPTGEGKTSRALRYVRKNNLSFVIIHPRMSMDTSFKNKGMDSYRDSDRNNKTKSKAKIKRSVCVNSLCNPTFNRELRKAQVVIIDEMRAVLKNEMINNEKTAKSFANLFSLLHSTASHRSTRFIILDANLSASDIAFIQKFRPYTIPILGKEWKANGHICHVLDPIPNVKFIPYNLFRHHDFDKQPMIFLYNKGVDTCIEPNIMALELFQKSIGKRFHCLHVHRDTREATQNMLYTNEDNYNCFFISPTICEGVSIEHPRYANWIQFGFYCCTTNGSDSCAQQMRRFRCCKESYVYIDQTRVSCDDRIPSFISIDEHLKTLGDAYNVSWVKDTYRDLFEKNITEYRLNVGVYFYESFLQFLVNNEFTLQAYKTCDYLDPDDLKMLENLVDIRSKEIRECILNAPSLSEEEYKKLTMDFNVSREQEWAMYKYKLENQLHIRELSHDSILEWPVAAIRKMKRLRMLLPEQDITEAIQNDVLNTQFNISGEFEFASQKKYVFVPDLLHSELNTIVAHMGFKHLLDTECIQPNISKVLEYMKNPAHIKILSNVLRVNTTTIQQMKPDDVLPFVSQKLRDQFGISIYDIGEGYVQACVLPLRMSSSPDAPHTASIYECNGDSKYDVFFTRGNLHTNHCDTCDENISGGVGLEHLHSEKHIAKTQGLTCDKCNIYKTDAPSNLKRHRATCKPKKTFVCEHCQYSARDNYDLKKHMGRRHTEK